MGAKGHCGRPDNASARPSHARTVQGIPIIIEGDEFNATLLVIVLQCQRPSHYLPSISPKFSPTLTPFLLSVPISHIPSLPSLITKLPVTDSAPP